MPTPNRPLSPCLPAMRLDGPAPTPSRWTPPPEPRPASMRLSPRDLLEVVQLGSRYSVAVTLAPAARPTGQVDDLNERLIHAARFLTYAAALRLQARIARAQRIDVSCWTWTPREHGRFVGAPTATPYDVER